jgi:hypothetical protein
MISFLVAFVTTTIVLIFSRISYKRFVEKRCQNQQETVLEQDTLDKIEDPFDLYSDEVKEEDKSKKLDKVLAKSKEVIKTYPAFFSLLRLSGYVIFILGFFYLQDNNLLIISNYLIGVTVSFILQIILIQTKKI